MSRVRLTELATQLSAHPGLGPLASVLTKLARSAWRSGDVVFPRPGAATWSGVEPPPGEVMRVGELDLTDALRRGARSSDELDIITVLILLETAAAWPREPREATELAQILLWLETYSGLHCLTASNAVLDGARHRQLAEAILRLLEGAGGIPRPSPAELQNGRSWLSSCESPECRDLAIRSSQLPGSSSSGAREPEPALQGMLGPRPRHPLTTSLLAITGLLFLIRAGRGLGRLVLLRRTPTSLWLSDRGLELFSRHEMLGRVIRERRVIVPIEDIRAVEREVRFPRLGLYAGLLALALGTLLGTRLFIDGLRVAGLSYPLMAMGLICIAAGVVLDIVFSGFGDSMRGRCRLVVSTHRGPGWAIGELEPAGVDRLLTELSTQLAARRGG